MEQKINSLVATLKNVDIFGTKYAADFLPASVGGQQFALIHTTVASLGTLGGTQVSGGEQVHGGVLAKAACRLHLYDDLLAITTAAHTLVLLGNTTIGGKFLLPHNNGDQALLNAARAFSADAPAFSAALLTVGVPATFITQLNTDIAFFETAITAKDTAQQTQAGATGSLADNAHKAAVAVHALNTVVKNAYKTNPQRLAEWVVASHVEKHTPVPRPPTPTPPPAK